METPAFTPPDSNKWTFLGIGDRPLQKGEVPVAAHVPIDEVVHILSMVSYMNRQIAGCNAVKKSAP